jgi:hypothetical protein
MGMIEGAQRPRFCLDESASLVVLGFFRPVELNVPESLDAIDCIAMQAWQS